MDTGAISPSSNSADVLQNSTGDALTRDVIMALNIYVLPVFIIFGIIGNTISFLVFVTGSLRHQSSSVYLAFLNLADCLFLLCLFIAHLEWYRVYPMRMQGFCQIVVYFSYISGFLSVWTVVSFTVERFIVVYFPLKRLAHCTKRRAINVAVGLLFLSMVLYNFALWTSGIFPHPVRQTPTCVVIKRFAPLMHGVSIMDTLLTLVVPSVLIIVLNILIVMGVWKFIRQRGALQEGNYGGSIRRVESMPLTEVTSQTVKVEQSAVSQPSPPQSADTANQTEAERKRSSRTSIAQRIQGRTQALQLRTTRTLLTISTVFVVLNLPSHAFRVWATLNPQGDRPSENLLLLQSAFQFLYYLNFSCNLLMYCACMQTFRIEVGALATKSGRAIVGWTLSIHASVKDKCSKE